MMALPSRCLQLNWVGNAWLFMHDHLLSIVSGDLPPTFQRAEIRGLVRLNSEVAMGNKADVEPCLEMTIPVCTDQLDLIETPWGKHSWTP